MSTSNARRMKGNSSKKNKKKIFFLFVLILLIVVVIFIAKQIMNNKAEQNENKPTIYYTYNDQPEKPLVDDTNVFSVNTTISWSEDCSGIIEKDGKEFSRENSVTLVDEGNYEIIVESKKEKSKSIKKIKIDKTPPDVEIAQSSTGSYTITFADVNDIGTATLTKFDKEAKKIVEKIDLKEEGLKKSIEIKDKGSYVLRVTDNVGNLYEGKNEFDIE